MKDKVAEWLTRQTRIYPTSGSFGSVGSNPAFVAMTFFLPIWHECPRAVESKAKGSGDDDDDGDYGRDDNDKFCQR